MQGHGSKFERKKEEAIAALLTQRNVEEAARAVKVSAGTLLRWMKEPQFDIEYRNARRRAFSQSIARLQQGASAAATTLLKVMIDPASPAATRVRAADSVLHHAGGTKRANDMPSVFMLIPTAGVAGNRRSFPARGIECYTASAIDLRYDHWKGDWPK